MTRAIYVCGQRKVLATFSTMSLSVHDISDEEEKNLAEAAIFSPEDDPEFPDGGFRAWMVVLGAYLVLFSTFGVVNSYVRARLERCQLRGGTDTGPVYSPCPCFL